MSGFASMTVYAEETQDFTDAEKTDNSIYNYAHISYEKDYELSTNEMKTSVKEKLKHN